MLHIVALIVSSCGIGPFLLNKLILMTDASTHMSRRYFLMIGITGLSTTDIKQCGFDT